MNTFIFPSLLAVVECHYEFFTQIERFFFGFLRKDASGPRCLAKESLNRDFRPTKHRLLKVLFITAAFGKCGRFFKPGPNLD
jgi:hypothetical protein